MAGVSGSGARENAYANEVAGPQNLGTGNQLESVGSLESFNQINANVVPAPAAEFFIGGQSH